MNSKSLRFSPILALALTVSPWQASAQPSANTLETQQQQFLQSQAPALDTLDAEQQQFLQAVAPAPAQQKQPIASPKTAFGDLEPQSPELQPEPDRQPEPEPPAPTPEPPAPPSDQPGTSSRTTPAPSLPPLTSPQSYSRVVPLPVVQPTPQASAAPTPLTIVQPLMQKLAFSFVPSFERLLQGAETLLYPLVKPVEVTSPFGWRVHPISGTTRFHSGVDLGAPLGSPVLAAFSGRVVSADWMGGYGNAIVLQHGAGLRSLYAHLSESLVSPGQFIPQGAVIGLSGSTGNSTGPHLHFEVRRLELGEWTAITPSSPLKVAQSQLFAARTRLPVPKKVVN